MYSPSSFSYLTASAFRRKLAGRLSHSLAWPRHCCRCEHKTARHPVRGNRRCFVDALGWQKPPAVALFRWSVILAAPRDPFFHCRLAGAGARHLAEYVERGRIHPRGYHGHRSAVPKTKRRCIVEQAQIIVTIVVAVVAADTAEAIITIVENGTTNEIYNIAGGFEQSNHDTVKKVIKEYCGEDNIESYIDLSYSRVGQDVRYALDDSKLKSLGWEPKMNFDIELFNIVNYYKNKFIW